MDKLSYCSAVNGNGNYEVGHISSTSTTFFGNSAFIFSLLYPHFSDFTYPPLNTSSDATSLECERLVSALPYSHSLLTKWDLI